MGAAGTQTEPSWEAEHCHSPQSPSSISFPSFSGKARPPALGILLSCFARLLVPLWLLSASYRSCGPSAKAGVSFPPSPILPLGSRPPQRRWEAWVPAGIDALGEERFLAARLSGALRQGSFPAPAASPSLPSSGLGLAEAAREGARARRLAPAGPRPDRCRRRLLSSHGRAPRLCPEDQQVISGVGRAAVARGRGRESSRAGPRRRVGVATRTPGSRGLARRWAEGLVAATGVTEASRRPRPPALRPRLQPSLSLGYLESPGRPPPTVPRRPGPGVLRLLIEGRVGEFVGRPIGASQILCVPTPGARGPAAPRHPLSPPTPRLPLEGAGVRPPLHPNKRSGARRAAGECEAAPLSRLLLALRRNLTGAPLRGGAPFRVGSCTQNFKGARAHLKVDRLWCSPSVGSSRMWDGF